MCEFYANGVNIKLSFEQCRWLNKFLCEKKVAHVVVPLNSIRIINFYIYNKIKKG